MNNLAVKHSQFMKQGCARLTLLLSNFSDEKIVRNLLSEEYNISSTKESFKTGQFDVLITDEPNFRKCAFHYKKIKQQSLPIVLPVLLLTKDETFIDLKSKFAEIVDDILFMPTSPEVLRSRIKLLLQTRDYSKKLDNEKKKYQLLAENSTDLISTHKPCGEYEYASPSSQSIFGYKPDELIEKNNFDFILEEDLETVIKGWEQTIKTREPSIIEFRKKTKAGNYKWVESVIKTLELPKGSDTVQIQAATRDITERKNFEQKLKKETSFSNATLDTLPNIFFMVDADLNIVRWNKNLEKNLGYSKQEIINMTPFDFFEKKDHKRVNKKIQDVFTSGEAEMEADLITKKGELIRHKISGREFIEGDKKYIIGTCVDVARDYKNMNELKVSNAEKQVLLLEIHHRVKNNLAVVSSMLQLQAMESDDPLLTEKLSDSELRIKSIASVHELLYQSKSFSQLDMEEYLSTLISNIMGTNRSKQNISIIQNTQSVTLNINQAIPCSLIFNELITNSLKHAFIDQDKGQIKITLNQSLTDEVQLIVEDNGNGLDKELDFKKPNSLGIRLIDVLTKQLQGQLEVTSKNGTRFCLTFKKQETKGSANNFL